MTIAALEAVNLPPVIMTDEEMEHAEEEWIENLRDHLVRLEQPKPRQPSAVKPQMLRTKDAAKYLGISEWQLREMVASGQIEVVRHKYFLFAVADLDRWIARNREREVI